MTVPCHVRVSGVLESFAAGFAVALTEHGYRPRPAVRHMRLMAHVSQWLTAESLGAADLACATERFLRARRVAGGTTHVTGRGLQPLLAYLRRVGVVPAASPAVPIGPVEITLVRYQDYLTRERGLGAATARGYVHAARPFLRRHVSPDGLVLESAQLRAVDVTTFVVVRTPTQSRHAAKLTVCALRSLLRFLYLDGAITQSLAAAVPSVAGWRLAGLPTRVDAAQVRRLLVSCDRQTTAGCRDVAILTTLARLGLRAAEVATLRLDDIDWGAGEIVVHGKGARLDRLPLPMDVGTVIAAYLREGRPATAQGRTVFVRLMAPHGALSAVGVTQVVAAAARRAGLGVLHAHRLRHFAATETLRAGGSLAEVQQLLRHTRAQTTAIYAKVDREALRTIARPWPGGVA